MEDKIAETFASLEGLFHLVVIVSFESLLQLEESLFDGVKLAEFLDSTFFFDDSRCGSATANNYINMTIQNAGSSS